MGGFSCFGRLLVGLDRFSDDVVVDLFGSLRFFGLWRGRRRNWRSGGFGCWSRDWSGSRRGGPRRWWRRDGRFRRGNGGRRRNRPNRGGRGRRGHGRCRRRRRNRKRWDCGSGRCGSSGDTHYSDLPGTAVYPRIHDDGDDPGQAKLEDRAEDPRKVVIALAEIKWGLRIASHLPGKEWEDEVSGKGEQHSPDSFGGQDSDDDAANPAAGILRDTLGGRLRALVHDCVMQIVA